MRASLALLLALGPALPASAQLRALPAAVSAPGGLSAARPMTPSLEGAAPLAVPLALHAPPAGEALPAGPAALSGALRPLEAAPRLRTASPRTPSLKGALPTLRSLNAVAEPGPRRNAQARSAAEAAASAGLVRFDGARRAEPDKPLQGKRLLVVGSLASRPFLVDETRRVADELGLEVVVLDSGRRRGNSRHAVADEAFIEADIDDHSPENEAAIAAKVAAYAAEKPIHASLSFLNGYTRLASYLAHELGAAGFPWKAVAAAEDKAAAREAFRAIPEIATPFKVVRSAEEARLAFAEMGTPRVVLKPVKGGGSEGVIVGIDSPEAAASAYEETDAKIRAYMRREDAGWSNLDRHPGILMEAQLEGPEVDVELVVQDGQVRFWHVSDNPPMERPLAVEKGITFPSRLTREQQLSLLDAAQRAVTALGLTSGNVHLEAILTPQGPRILEVNPRMGGAFVWEVVRLVTGVSLIEEAIRAVTGLEVRTGRAPPFVLEARFAIPRASGLVESIEGVEEARAMEGVERIRVLKKAGDPVLSPEKDTFDYLLYAFTQGRDYDEAMDRMLAALRRIKIGIRALDGSLVEQDAAHTHRKEDPAAILREAARSGGGRSGLAAWLRAVRARWARRIGRA